MTSQVMLELKRKYSLKDLSVVIEKLPKRKLEILRKKAEVNKLLASLTKRQLPKKLRDVIDIEEEEEMTGISIFSVEQNNFPCPYINCGFKGKFTTQLELSMHLKRYHEGVKNPYKCTECEKCFQTLQFLEDHQNVHRNEKPYMCEICSSTYYSKTLLNTHRRGVHDVHERKQVFPCKVCLMKFSSKKLCLSHQISTHPEEKNARSFNCKQCESVFSSRSKLTEHTAMLHRSPDDSRQIFQCPFCDYKAIYQSKLKQHMLRHSSNKNVTCPICQQQFKRNSALNAHQSVHLDGRPFKCPVCSKSFKMKKTLTVHELLHTGTMNYQCSLCPKAYPTSTHLAMHMKSHRKRKEREQQCVHDATSTISSHHVQISEPESVSLNFTPTVTCIHNIQQPGGSSELVKEMYPFFGLFS